MKQKFPKVSVIVTTRNEEAHIRRCLESVKRQTYKPIECIVVDNNSIDKTISVAKRYTRRVYLKGPERSVQRNFGATKASGEYFFFIDADMILTPSVVGDCVQKMNDSRKYHTLVALIIPEQSFGETFWAKCKAMERSYYVGVDYIEAARFFRRDVFENVGEYDKQMTGPEDFDLNQRVKEMFGKSSVGRISAYILHNEGKLTLKKILSKKFYYAKDIDQYTGKLVNKEYYRKQASILNRYALYFSRPSTFFHDPIVFCGMVFLKTMEFAAGGFGWLYNKMR